MDKIPQNFYRYFQNQIWDKNNLPKWFSSSHNTKAWIYWLIHVLDWQLKYTSFKSQNWEIDQEIILSKWETWVSLPTKWHKVEPIGDMKMMLEFFKEKDKKVQEIENEFKQVFPGYSPHYEVEYLSTLIPDKSWKKLLDLWAWLWRNSLFMSFAWFDVTSWDKNIDGLNQIKENSSKNNLSINTKIKDLNNSLVDENYDVIISTVALQFLNKQSAQNLINSMIEKTNIWWYNLIIIPIDSPDFNCPIRFPNLISYQDYLDIYKDWEVIHKDNMFWKFHKNDENWYKIMSRFITLIAKKVK